MKTCSVNYVFSAITLISVLFTIRQSTFFWDLPGLVRMLVDGLPTVLFFHLAGKLAGLSLGLRIVVAILFPVAGYTAWEWLRDADDQFFVEIFPPWLLFAFCLIKFMICAIVAETGMSYFASRVKFLQVKEYGE